MEKYSEYEEIPCFQIGFQDAKSHPLLLGAEEIDDKRTWLGSGRSQEGGHR